MVSSTSHDEVDCGLIHSTNTKGKNNTDCAISASSIPHPQSLQELCDILKLEFGSKGIEDVNVPRIQAIMSAYISNEAEWESYAHFDSHRYTRNLVDDGNGKYNLILLCWGPGHQSAVHDHSNSHCIMKIMSGKLVEVQYAWPNGEADEAESKPLRVINQSLHKRDAATYIHDKIGLHRVGNPSRSESSVSLHLYAPPINLCQTFSEKSGQARSSGICTFYSVAGKKVSNVFSQ